MRKQIYKYRIVGYENGPDDIHVGVTADYTAAWHIIGAQYMHVKSEAVVSLNF